MNKVIILKKENGEEIIIDDFPFQIGSFNKFCQLTLTDREIAAIHCVIDSNDNKVTLHEMNTRIGVNLNSQTIKDGDKVEIKDSDLIKIGNNQFTVLMDSSLLRSSEVSTFNKDYKRLLDASNNNKEVQKEASLIIKGLWDKIKLVNNHILINNKSQSLQEASNGYLKNVFSKDLDLGNIKSIKTSESVDKIQPKINKENQEQRVKSKDNKFHNKEIPRESFHRKISKNTFETKRTNTKFGNLDETVSLGNFRNKRVINSNRNVNSSRNINQVSDPGLLHPAFKEEQVVPYLELRETQPPFAKIIIEKTPCKIGVSESVSDLILDRPGISRIHATFLRNNENNGFFIRDNNSTNGTYINNKRIINAEAPIRKGDLIKLFNYEFRVIILK